jgi:TonB family protein
MAAPPLIGTKIEFEPTDKARIDTAPSAQSQTDVQSTHTRPDRAKSFDVPLITSPLPRMSVASNLPPSSGGIPPSSAGIPPRGNRLRSSRHSDGTALNRDAVLLRVLAGAALAIIGMAVFVVFLGSRKVHVSEAMPLNAALEIRNTKPPIPARAALLSVPRRHPQPQATAMHSSQQSTHYHVANPLMAESRPAISATPRGPNQAAHPGSGQPIPPHENAPVAVKKNVSLVDSADGIGRHDEGSNPGEKQNAMPVNASGNVVPHADPQILPSAASTLCATPDAAAHLLTKASAELSPRTLAAAAGKTVVIAVDVAPDGSVRDAAIVTRSGETRLDLAALSVASRSTYASTEQNCVASPGSVTVTVNF